MSWLARSIANSLRLDEEEEESSQNDAAPSSSSSSSSSPKRGEEEEAAAATNQLKAEGGEEEASRGVKEDLTELRQTLTRQIWGVANFLAPDPPRPDPGADEDEEAVGITEEVLAFARNIAMHPETWLDFPLDEEDDLDDFDMSEAQLKHAFYIERFAPRLAALRIELCPCHMTESYFWKVYFVLLHSRLNRHDAQLLSTPQVMEARAMWMQELHKQTKPEDDWFGTSTSFIKDRADTVAEDYGCAQTFNFDRAIDPDSEEHPIASTSEVQFIDKSVIDEKPVIKSEQNEVPVGPSSKVVPDFEDDDNYWLEEDSDLGSYKATISVGNEDDISFSDLEDYGSSTQIESILRK